MVNHITAGLIWFDDISPWVFLGILFGGVPLGLRGMNARHLRPSPGGFTLRRPWEQRAFLGLMSFMFLLVPLMIAGHNLRIHSVTPSDLWPGGIFTGMCLMGAFFLLWGSYPQELAVDEGRRTYHRREGWPPFRRVYTGSLSDLAGVWAEAAATSNRSYLVYVGWQTGPGKMIAEQFGSDSGAGYYADGLAAVLGVPRLEWTRRTNKVTHPLEGAQSYHLLRRQGTKKYHLSREQRTKTE